MLACRCVAENKIKQNLTAAPRFIKNGGEITKMRRNWPFFKDSDWLILVFVHSAKPTAELENLAVSPSLSSPGLSYDTKFVHIGRELRSSLLVDTILGVQSEPACTKAGYCWVKPQLRSLPP